MSGNHTQKANTGHSGRVPGPKVTKKPPAPSPPPRGPRSARGAHHRVGVRTRKTPRGGHLTLGRKVEGGGILRECCRAGTPFPSLWNVSRNRQKIKPNGGLSPGPTPACDPASSVMVQ